MQHEAARCGAAGLAGLCRVVWLLRKPVFSKLGTARHVLLCWGMQEGPRDQRHHVPSMQGCQPRAPAPEGPGGSCYCPFPVLVMVSPAHTRALTHTQTHKSRSLSLRVRRRSVFASLGTAKDASAYLTGSLLFLFHFLSSP